MTQLRGSLHPVQDRTERFRDDGAVASSLRNDCSRNPRAPGYGGRLRTSGDKQEGSCRNPFVTQKSGCPRPRVWRSNKRCARGFLGICVRSSAVSFDSEFRERLSWVSSAVISSIRLSNARMESVLIPRPMVLTTKLPSGTK